MKASIILKTIFAAILFRSGIVDRKLARRCKAGSFPVLMYHRIILQDETIQNGMYVAPETFDRHLRYLTKNFDVISLKELALSFDNGTIASREKAVCVLTFDDGWKDFFNFSFPLLQKHQVPATVFLPTEFIGSNKKFWTDNFADIFCCRQPTALKNISKPNILKIVQRLHALQGTLEAQLEAGIAVLKNYPLDIIDEVILELSRLWGKKKDVYGFDFLNWLEVREMLNSGLISFGSHTVTHQILTTLDDAAVKRELADSRDKLLQKQVVDSAFIPFCYPNGNYNDKIVSMVQNTGYNLAVTTKMGWNHQRSNPFTLRRIGIHQDMTSTIPLFACRIAGFV